MTTLNIIEVFRGIFFFTIYMLGLNTYQDVPAKFELNKQEFKAERTNQIALHDLDNDGDLDAVFSNMGFNNSRVLFNDGKGNFIDSKQNLTQQGHGVDVGDIDGDGDPDLIITCAGWSVDNVEHTKPTSIYFNNSKGIFDQKKQLDDKLLSGNSVKLLDIDGDNDLDAFIRYYEEKDIIYLNDGKGNFTVSSIKIPENANFADFNNDQLPDMLIRESGKGYIVLINKGAKFKKHQFIKDTKFTRVYSDFTDINHDGYLDVIICNGSRNADYPTQILLNNGKGKFKAMKQELGSAVLGRLGSGDLNGDGFTDIIISGFKQNPSIYLNDGTGNLTKFTEIEGKGAFHHPIIRDVDKDGDNDIFIAHFFGGKNELWINQK